jgi:hypothetical protein
MEVSFVKVVNLSLVEGFLLHQQLHCTTLLNTYTILGVIFEENFSTPTSTPHV